MGIAGILQKIRSFFEVESEVMLVTEGLKFGGEIIAKLIKLAPVRPICLHHRATAQHCGNLAINTFLNFDSEMRIPVAHNINPTMNYLLFIYKPVGVFEDGE